MCSPTKVGEYLAAGLSIVGLDGIDVLDRLSLQSSSINVLARKKKQMYLTFDEAMYFLNSLKNPYRKKQSKDLALRYYSLDSANELYMNLYSEILT